jgi:hypothetical protein
MSPLGSDRAKVHVVVITESSALAAQATAGAAASAGSGAAGASGTSGGASSGGASSGSSGGASSGGASSSGGAQSGAAGATGQTGATGQMGDKSGGAEAGAPTPEPAASPAATTAPTEGGAAATPSAATTPAAATTPSPATTPGPSPSPTVGVNPMALADYPRPPDDTGRGVHWIPTTSSSKETVDRFVKEAMDMHVKWVVFLNEGAQIGDNDYLVQRLTGAGIMPVMRILTHRGAPLGEDLTPMVEHYVTLGVVYYQIYNEPNLASENEGREPSVERYVNMWVPAAEQVVKGGGLPGFGGFAPNADVSDLDFMRASLQLIKQQGHAEDLDKAWVAVHNYLQGDENTPVDVDPGFVRPKLYDKIANEELGRSLPMIGTEGGFGSDHPAHDEADRTVRVLKAYAAVAAKKDPFDFAYTYWVLANAPDGTGDPAFDTFALFGADGQTALAQALKQTP